MDIRTVTAPRLMPVRIYTQQIYTPMISNLVLRILIIIIYNDNHHYHVAYRGELLVVALIYKTH